MFESEVEKLLRYLMAASRFEPPLHRSTHAARMDFLSKIVMACAGVLFLAIIVLGVWIYIADVVSNSLIGYAKLLVLLIAMLVIGSVALSTISGVVSIFRASKDFCEDIVGQAKYDMKSARYVLTVSKSSKDYVRKILEQRLKRIDYRISQLFGGGDKLALFSLAGMGWSAYKELGQAGMMFESIPNFFNFVLYIFLALVFGMSLGAMFVRKISDKCRYSIELLEQADLLAHNGGVEKVSKTL